MEWAGGPSPPPCGQLTCCFSAVAELLVTFPDKSGVYSTVSALAVGNVQSISTSEVKLTSHCAFVKTPVSSEKVW